MTTIGWSFGGTYPGRTAGALLCLLLAAGCGGAMENIRVDLPAYRPAGAPPSAPASPASVRIEPVSDARSDSVGSYVGERTTLGDISMGSVDLEPPPTAAVAQVLRAEIERMGHRVVASGEQVSVSGRLLKFRLVTPATAVYWDINGEVELALTAKRSAGAAFESRYAVTCTDRTYVWPGEEIIGKVFADCAGKLGASLRGDAALASFLAGR